MKKFLGCSILALGLFASPAWADSNASGGNVIDSETQYLGDGPFSHGAGIGNGDNSIVSNINFSGSFVANRLRFSGTATSVIPTTWSNEVRMRVTDGNFFTPSFIDFVAGSGQEYTTFDYNQSISITGVWAGGVNVTSGGPWTVEFWDSFDDGAGADAVSTNVSMTFENVAPIVDSDGTFSLGTITSSASSVGELALAGLFDSYTFTLGTAGTLDIWTEFENVFTGNELDTEIALFDGSGNLLAENDDAVGVYSALNGLVLDAGDYTLVVAGWNTAFGDGFSVTPGNSTGDYRVNFSFTAIPEPSAVLALGLAAMGLASARRRRR